MNFETASPWGFVYIRTYLRTNVYLFEDSVSPAPTKYRAGLEVRRDQLQV